MRKDFKVVDSSKKYLITGGAGFIGYHLSKDLLKKGCTIIGLDNLNDYYNVQLKLDRLKELQKFDSYRFIKGDLSDKDGLNEIFEIEKPEIIVNLGAQAGVRYSIDNPNAYMQSNMIGFYNILECCRKFPVEHLIYASSSSVYGANRKVPFSTEDKTDHPISFYAATKKSNELMAHCYSSLFGIPATGLRFFTVYGSFGRPDMAYFKFAEKIMKQEVIQIYNNGDMLRDFTYIDDIVQGISNVLCNPPMETENGARYKIYNIGSNKPQRLMDFILTLEKHLGKEAQKEFMPMQPGDVYQTYADVTELFNDFGFIPKTSMDDGLKHFVDWFKEYYQF